MEVNREFRRHLGGRIDWSLVTVSAKDATKAVVCNLAMHQNHLGVFYASPPAMPRPHLRPIKSESLL